jgi:polar amino acid transport system substrate-binding protein
MEATVTLARLDRLLRRGTTVANKGLRIVALLGVAALALAACGGKTSDNTKKSASVQVSKDTSLNGQLPDAVRKKGQLVVGTDPSYAPIEFAASGGGFQGLDIDLGNAIASKLGIKFTFKQAQFDGILAGINSGRFDLAMSAFTDTKAREAQNTFVTYFQAGTSIGVKKGNPNHIKSQTDLCGLKVGAEKGTTQADALTKTTAGGAITLKGTCLKDKKRSPVPVLLPDQNAVNAAVVAGRADAFISDSPVVDYQVKIENGQIEQGGTTTDVAPYGIALPKNSPIAPVIQKAVQALIADGTYMKILNTWGIQNGAITESKIDAAVG